MYFPNSGGYNPKLDIIPKVEAEGKTIDDACVGLIEKLVEYHSFLVEAESFETQNPDYIMHKKYLDLIMVKEQE